MERLELALVLVSFLAEVLPGKVHLPGVRRPDHLPRAVREAAVEVHAPFVVDREAELHERVGRRPVDT